jgi:hypothetical protein
MNDEEKKNEEEDIMRMNRNCMGFTFQRARPMEGIKIMKENSANNPHGITFPTAGTTWLTDSYSLEQSQE